MTQNRQRKQAVDEMLENVGLFDVRERYANKLSGGIIKVDLPAPLGPNKPNIPVGISRLTSFNAWFPFG